MNNGARLHELIVAQVNAHIESRLNYGDASSTFRS